MEPVLSVSVVTFDTASVAPEVAPATGWYGCSNTLQHR
jgi:hypothetical protein